MREHIIVFIISTLLFITGVLTGVTISHNRLNEIEVTINEFKQNINSLETIMLISDSLSNEVSCSFQQEKINETQQQLDELSTKIINYETQESITNDYYRKIKKQYNLLRMEYWLMLEKLRNQCSNNYTTILFFYKTEKDCPACRDQGVILSHVAHNNNVYIIPVDIDENLTIVRIVSQSYEINTTPAIIINSEKIITGLINETNLLAQLNQ